MRVVAGFVLAVVCVVAMSAEAVGAGSNGEKRYVVVLEKSAGKPGVVAQRHAAREGATLERVFTRSLNGYAATLSAAEAKAIARQPGVAAVGLDPIGEPASQWNPHGVRRMFAADQDCSPGDNPAVNQNLDIDCIDDVRVDADIAVLDTPINPATADVNVVSNVDCFGNDPTPGNSDPSDHTGCDAGYSSETSDCREHHGEAVADLIAAIDNGIGNVGPAPGARIWSVGVGQKDIIDPSDCNPAHPFYMSDVIAGVEWVTAHADDIEVANMSLAFQRPTSPAGQALDAALEQAIETSTDAGVIYVVAAANKGEPAANWVPAAYDRPITASATFDSDGLPGGNGDDGPTCVPAWLPQPQTLDKDDTNSDASNYGNAANPNNLDSPGVDIAAPGTCTSGAAAYTSAAAAILASQDNPNNQTDVANIRNTLLTTANPNNKSNGGYDDQTGTTREPLLDVSDEEEFEPLILTGTYGIGTVSRWWGLIDIFPIGHAGEVLTRWFTDWTGWSHGWGSLGEPLVSAPAVASRYEGIIDMYVLGPDRTIKTKWYSDSTNWSSGWGSLGGPFATSPAAVSRSVGVIDVFATRADGNIGWKGYSPESGQWTNWSTLSGDLISAPTAASRYEGIVDLYALGNDRTIKTKWYSDGTGWSSGWGSLGGPFISAPTAVSRDTGIVDVFALAPSHDIMRKWYNPASGQWSSWISLGGPFDSTPSAVSVYDGRVDLFAKSDDTIYHRTYDDGSWSPWQPLSP